MTISGKLNITDPDYEYWFSGSQFTNLGAFFERNILSFNISALEGDETLYFSLREIAPTEVGSHRRVVTMGLMDYNNWATEGSIVHYEFPFILNVE